MTSTVELAEHVSGVGAGGNFRSPLTPSVIPANRSTPDHKSRDLLLPLPLRSRSAPVPLPLPLRSRSAPSPAPLQFPLRAPAPPYFFKSRSRLFNFRTRSAPQ